MHIFGPESPRPNESEILEAGLNNLCFSKSSRWFWYTLKFKNHGVKLCFLSVCARQHGGLGRERPPPPPMRGERLNQTMGSLGTGPCCECSKEPTQLGYLGGHPVPSGAWTWLSPFSASLFGCSLLPEYYHPPGLPLLFLADHRNPFLQPRPPLSARLLHKWTLDIHRHRHWNMAVAKLFITLPALELPPAWALSAPVVRPAVTVWEM